MTFLSQNSHAQVSGWGKELASEQQLVLAWSGPSCRQPIDGATIVPKLIPLTGVYRMYTNLQHVVPFKVSVAQGQHFFVKLERGYHQPVIEMFVRAGETLELKVPPGTYRLKYGTGIEWYGFGLCFGNESIGATYNTSDVPLRFSVTERISGNTIHTHYNGQQVKLYAVPRGNFHTHNISRDDF